MRGRVGAVREWRAVHGLDLRLCLHASGRGCREPAISDRACEEGEIRLLAAMWSSGGFQAGLMVVYTAVAMSTAMRGIRTSVPKGRMPDGTQCAKASLGAAELT